ncbi:MAG: AbrB/MazE/SpoVT family DNA-binding domain-containing protein [Chloroflexi bacterium]|nr:AbrB/MazE/SpoVT family DNA-binding domain-containing protein [Chloroflexota bacterium]
MGTTAVKITRKGQVTIPREIREELNANAVYFEVANGIVMVKPVRDAAGSLKEYARTVKPGISMKRMKDRAWEEAVREKRGKKSS